MKQLTANPSTRSATSGWELFQALVQVVLPSKELREFVRSFLQRRADCASVAKPGDGSPSNAVASRSRGTRSKSICGEAELRTPDHSDPSAVYQTTTEPALAAETLKLFLQQVIDKLPAAPVAST